MKTQSKRLKRILLSIAILLLLPLIGTLLTDSMNWDLFDFILAGVLLLGTGLACELVLRKVRKKENRIALCAAILVALFLIWAEIAVGIFGTPFAGTELKPCWMDRAGATHPAGSRLCFYNTR